MASLLRGFFDTPSMARSKNGAHSCAPPSGSTDQRECKLRARSEWAFSVKKRLALCSHWLCDLAHVFCRFFCSSSPRRREALYNSEAGHPATLSLLLLGLRLVDSERAATRFHARLTEIKASHAPPTYRAEHAEPDHPLQRRPAASLRPARSALHLLPHRAAFSGR